MNHAHVHSTPLHEYDMKQIQLTLKKQEANVLTRQLINTYKIKCITYKEGP